MSHGVVIAASTIVSKTLEVLPQPSFVLPAIAGELEHGIAVAVVVIGVVVKAQETGAQALAVADLAKLLELRTVGRLPTPKAWATPLHISC